MASHEEEALVRLGAERAVVVVGQVIGAFSLLVEGMGDRRITPDRDQALTWSAVIAWLSGCLEAEAGNLADSLRHDEIVASPAGAAMSRLFRAAGDPMPATPPKMPIPPPIGRPPRVRTK